MANIVNLGAQPIDPGESLVIRHLQRELPDSFQLVPNVELVDRFGGVRGQPYEYDLIVVSPHAIYVVEIKRWTGRIEGDDFDWVLNGRVRRPNPLRSANHKARILKNALVRESPAFRQVWVEGCVIIADDQVSILLTGDCADRVFKYTDAPAFLRDANEAGQSPGHLLPLVDGIVNALRGGSRPRAPGPLEFGQYRVVEPLGTTPLANEYLARHILLRESPIYRLRVFQVSPYLPEEEARRRRETITRDFQALQAIGDHPNLLRVQDFFPHNGQTFVEVTEWSNEGMLRKLMSNPNAPITLERKLEIVRGIARGLAAAHSRNILHRDVRPENILIAWDGTPRLMNFDRARIAREGYGTVWEGATTDLDRTYLPPELAHPDPKPIPASDLYSLGLVIFELFTGRLPYASLDDFLKLGGRLDLVPDSLPPGLPEELNRILSRLIVGDPAARYESAETLATDLDRLLTRAPAAGRSLSVTTIKERYEKDDMINGVYRVLEVLGQGGLAHVYHVYHLLQDRDFAMKIINADVNIERLQAEFKVMSQLIHPNVARAIWADRIHGGQYFLVTEFIQGETLSLYAEHKKRLSTTEIVRVAHQLLDALAYMHPKPEIVQRIREESGGELSEDQLQLIWAAQRGVFHRDIKPANLMITPEGLKIIDFNIADWSESVSPDLRGTPDYMAPDLGFSLYDASCELFSVGVILYELVTGHHPYPDARPSFENPPVDPLEYVRDLSPAFASFLVKSILPHRQSRFQTASEMLEALRAIDRFSIPVESAALVVTEPRASRVRLADSEIGRPNYNPYLTRFLTLHSQARVDNSGTRGLDEIALATYVPTRLDDALKPAILAGQHRLVIITGNAGDGKTAFIQQVEFEAQRLGATLTPTSESRNGHRFSLNGFEFVTNYDGSQDESERANDDVLIEFFAPFSGHEADTQTSNRVHVIAINEGRLRDFLFIHGTRFPSLKEIASNYFEPEVPVAPPEGILIINLNWRSVVAGGESSIFIRQIRAMIDDSLWAPCNSCAFWERCPTKSNVDTLRDPVSGPQVQERLRTLFEIVALRRQLHITMRDMRSALSYLLFRDRHCAEIINSLERASDPFEALDYLYYNGIAAPSQEVADEGNEFAPSDEGERGDRLIRLLQQIDVALVSNPADDRDLHFEGPSGLLLAEFSSRSRFELTLIDEARDSLPTGWMVSQDLALRERHRRLHDTLRRKAFFERRDNWRRMLPFKELSLFQQATQATEQSDREDALERLRRSLLVGLSASEGCRVAGLTERYVCLRAGGTDKPTIKSFRLFDARDFYLFVPIIDDRYLEYMPDSVLFRHRAASGLDHYDAELRVTVDLIELLSQVERGFVPSLNDIRGAYVNLLIFRNALAHLRYRDVVLLDDDGSTYRVSMDDSNVITLEKEK